MPSDAPLVSAITVSLLIVVTLCAITDILEHRIPNIVLLPALLVAIFVNSLLAGLPGLIDCFQGLVLGFAMLFPIYYLGGTSAGDVKLLAVVGALFGANGALIAGVASLCFGGVLGVLYIVWRVLEPVLATFIAQSVRSSGTAAPPPIRTMSSDSSWRHQFPYGPAIACGTYYTLWDLGYISRFLA